MGRRKSFIDQLTQGSQAFQQGTAGLAKTARIQDRLAGQEEFSAHLADPVFQQKLAQGGEVARQALTEALPLQQRAGGTSIQDQLIKNSLQPGPKELNDLQLAQLEGTEASTAFKKKQTDLLGQPKPGDALEDALKRSKLATQSSNRRLVDAKIEDMRKKRLQKGKDLNLTPFQEARDKQFAKDIVEFEGAGGFADVQKNFKTMEESIKSLKADPSLFGSIKGRLANTFFADVTVPETLALKQNIESVVQLNMRQTLGAQFTENEGVRLIERAFDPRLPAGENLKRIERIQEQIMEAARAKQDALDWVNGEGRGSLKGFKGRGLESFKKELSSAFTSKDTGKNGKAPKTIKKTTTIPTDIAGVLSADELERVKSGNVNFEKLRKNLIKAGRLD